ncbi:MAG: TrbI/VirB10 family protein [Boseongicola sp. SB0677_bin_26]|nr:TrbI/VirB10 family protein [Boseongicola sp. SB0677_bin_26]
MLAAPVIAVNELVERWRAADREDGPAGSAPSAPVSDPVSQPGAMAVADPASPAAALPALGARTHVLARGSVIPAVLESSIDSDLPGLVRAWVAETVYDTVTGGHVVIPRGSRLVGTYGSGAPTGQRRLFVSWTDLRLPDGTPVPLGGTGSLGADGASGVRGRRSTGIWTALGAAVLFDLAGNASQILVATETGQAPQRQDGLAEILGAALGKSTSQVGQEYLRELLDRGTRFRVAAGARMNVLVEDDMHLPAQPAPGAWP